MKARKGFFYVNTSRLKTRYSNWLKSLFSPYFYTMDIRKYSKYYKNKFIVAGCLFFVYVLFLDDVDIFTIVNQNRKLYRLEASRDEIGHKLDSTRVLYRELHTTRALESFAREKKFFKQKNEDIFVISYE